MIAMILLAAIETEPDEIVDDYLETVRLGDARAASARRSNDGADLEAFCRRHGTTTEVAFRAALRGFDVAGFLDRAGLSEGARQAVLSWRGTVEG